MNVPKSWRESGFVVMTSYGGKIGLSTGIPDQKEQDNAKIAIMAPELYHALKDLCNAKPNTTDRGIAFAKAKKLLKEVDGRSYAEEITINITDDMYFNLLQHAEEHGCTVSDIINRAVADTGKRIARHMKRVGEVRDAESKD